MHTTPETLPVTDIVLVINAGSSSIKFSVFALTDFQTLLVPLYRGAIENIGVNSRLIVKEDEMEQTFALPRTLAEQGIRRYGFHCLSYEYIAGVLPDHLGEQSDGRVVAAHLGGHGVSMCAMRQRKSIATTMSFTPLDGLPMSTRCGSIVAYLLQDIVVKFRVSDFLLNHHE